MFTRPATISDPTILELVTDLWAVDADRAEYSPVGFGSHHWLLGTAHGSKRFVTVDDLVAKRRSPLEPLEGTFDRLQAAFTTARDLVVLHDVGLGSVPRCRFEDFEVSNRDEFDAAWTRMDEVWDTGPHAETARELLRVNVDTVTERFETYDHLVVSALAVRDQWVVTHGEPHGSNVLTTGHDTRVPPEPAPLHRTKAVAPRTTTPTC